MKNNLILFIPSRLIMLSGRNYGILGSSLIITMTITIFLLEFNSDISHSFILPIFNLRKLVNTLIIFIEKLLSPIKKWSSGNGNDLKLLAVKAYGKTNKKLIIKVLKPYHNMELLLNSLYHFLNDLEYYNSINNKKVLVTAKDINNIDLTLNKAVFIKNNMSFEDFYIGFLPTLDKISESYYNMEPHAIILLEVVIFNLDGNVNKTITIKSNPFNIQKRSFHTTNSNFDLITPLKNS